MEENVLTIKNNLSKEEFDWLVDLPLIGFDLETNDLDPYIGDILLVILGDETNQYVFDAFSFDCKPLFDSFSDDKVYIAANGKFDYKFIKVKYSKSIKKIFDVMIAEQRLVQGTGYSSALDAIVMRRLGIVMNKQIRSEFVGTIPSHFRFSNKHIVYGAGDIDKLFKIRELQKQKIAERKQEFLIYKIEFPLIRRLADIELDGEDINIEKWRENIKNNKVKRFDSELVLDKEFRILRENIATPEDKKYISGGDWDRDRRKPIEVKQDTLFGDMFTEIETNPTGREKKKAKVKLPFINYSSTDILLHIFGRLKQPAPTIDLKTKQSGNAIIPTFKYKKMKKGGRFIINKAAAFPWVFSTGKNSIESYVIENPDLPIKNFVEELIKYRKYCTRISTFGENFLIKFKNKYTGKYHTVYRQCDAITGRLQSGDKDNGYYNSQNIPKEKEYRECFYYIDPDTGDHLYIHTTDWSGAEAVIMIDKARDERFYEIAIKQDDAHSPFATQIWNAIGMYRLRNGIKRNNHDKNPAELSTMVVTKKLNKDVRTLFKNTTFASIYGCGYKKYGKMLNIDVEEAKIGLGIMKNGIPKTFRMVEDNVKFALENGYLILNKRTNSRIWYLDVLNAKREGRELDNVHNVKNSAANAPIQGTQADMIKEAMVCIMDEADRQNLVKLYKFGIVKQVHDELVTKSNNIDVLVEFKKDDGTTEMVTIQQFVKAWMCQVANRYLSFITMSAEQEVLKTWTK